MPDQKLQRTKARKVKTLKNIAIIGNTAQHISTLFTFFTPQVNKSRMQIFMIY